MNNKTNNVAIAGYGVVGQRRREYIDSHPNFNTVAVCDIKYKENPVKSEQGANVYTNYKDMLDNEKIDVLFVCLTNDIAAEVTIAGLKNNMHVFCEKPPGRDLKDIADVIKAERQNPHLKLKYGFNHRYHESILKALEIIESGELGELINMRGVYGKSKIISYQSTWRAKRDIAGGGILLDQGIHMLDLMRVFAGEFVEFKSYVDNHFWGHDVEDNAYALMKSESGVVAFLNSSATQWRHRFHLEISLSKGAIILSGILSGSKSYGAETITIVRPDEDDAGDPMETTIRYNQDNSWKDEIEEFSNAVIDNTPIKFGTSKDAFKTMELVYKIYCADDQWKAKYNLVDLVEGFEI